MTESLIELQVDAFLRDLRKQMLRFTIVQLSDSHLADDVVQEDEELEDFSDAIQTEWALAT